MSSCEIVVGEKFMCEPCLLLRLWLDARDHDQHTLHGSGQTIIIWDRLITRLIYYLFKVQPVPAQHCTRLY